MKMLDRLNKFREKFQEKFQEMANGTRRDLMWKTRHVDDGVEAVLLKMHYE